MLKGILQILRKVGFNYQSSSYIVLKFNFFEVRLSKCYMRLEYMPPNLGRIEVWLSGHNESLATCWRKAHQEMAAKDGPAGATSLAHMARQIPKYLPEAFDITGGSSFNHNESVIDLDRLLNKRRAALFNMTEADDVTPSFQLEGEEVAVLKNMILEQRKLKESDYANVARSFLARALESDKEDPHLIAKANEWKKMQHFFNKMAHIRIDDKPNWEEFENNLEVLDSLLDLLAQSWFEREQELQELLEKANQN